MDLQAQLHSGENGGSSIDHEISTGDGAESLKGKLKGTAVYLSFDSFLFLVVLILHLSILYLL